MNDSASDSTDPVIDKGRQVLAGLDRQTRRPLGLAAAAGVAGALLWIPQAFVAAGLFGRLLAGEATHGAVALAAAAFFLLGILRHGLAALSRGILYRAALAAVARTRWALVESGSLASPLEAGSRSSAAGASLIGEKLDLLIPWLTRYRLAALYVAVVPLAILAAVFAVSWAAALILLVSGPLVPLFMALIGAAARDASRRQLAETTTLNGLLLEWLNAAADIRLLGAEDRTVERFARTAEDLRRRTMAVLRIAFLSSTVLELFSALGIAMTAVFVGFSLLGTFSFGAWGTPLSPAGGIFILLLVPDFFQPLRDLAAAWHDRAAALAVGEEIAQARAGPATTILGTGERAEPLPGPVGLATRDLAFTTGAGTELRFPDLTLAAGETVAITGPSGAGKSTLLALVAGMARPSSGSIRAAGVPLDDDTADRWRASIALVGQKPHLFNASLRANIALGGDGADRARIDGAVAAAALDDVVAGLPRGLDSRLGETGSGVSGGEARRLTIARAIHSGASLVLADEPTADLDAETADRVIEALLAAARRGAALLVATHDPRLVSAMDREIRLAVPG